ncbi:MAG: AraC family transcriptional regulator [Cyclobacteriaceae bacterium]
MAIFHVLIAFGAFQALFLSLVFFSQAKNNLPKKLFALFLFIEGFTLVERVLVESNLIESVPHILGISYPISFIKPPILFFMGLAIISQKFKLRKIHSLHFIPFFLILLMNVPFYLQPGKSKVEFVAAFVNYSPAYTDFNFYLFFSFFLYIGIYVFLTIRTLRVYHEHVKNNKLSNWYLWVLYMYGISLIISFAYFVVRPSGLVEIPLFNVISMLIMTFLVQSIAYSFLTKSSIFHHRSPAINNLEQIIRDEKAIRNKLEIEKVYLDDALNLEELARSLDFSKKYVSDLINQRFGSSFKEVLNQYRVEEAKRLMKRELGTNPPLITIGHQSGFNNKVSFYRTFKKQTGKSPSAYFQSLKSGQSKETVHS